AAASIPIRPGDWLLIDAWARGRGDADVYADITWTAYVGDAPPARHQAVFVAVLRARDAAVQALRAAHDAGEPLRGFEADAVARRVIADAGYGDFFTHRLGHSIGHEVHGNGAN